MHENVNSWKMKLEKLEKYYEENNKHPNKRSKDKDEKQLGQWLNDQKKYYKKKVAP